MSDYCLHSEPRGHCAFTSCRNFGEPWAQLSADSIYPVAGPNHALRTGMVVGLALKHGLDVVPDMTPEGDYQASMTLTLPEPFAGVKVRIVVTPAEGE